MAQDSTPVPSLQSRRVFAAKAASSAATCAGNQRGFTMVELLIVLLVSIIMTAMSVSPTMRMVHNYKINGAAIDVANILQRTRYEAIRRNTAINCRWQDSTNTFYIDVNKNAAIDPGERVTMLPGGLDVFGSGSVPNASSMNYSSIPLVRPASGIVASFDARGTVNFGAAAPAVYVVYLGFPGHPGRGFRAVTLMPTGQTKVWSAVPGGTWHSP